MEVATCRFPVVLPTPSMHFNLKLKTITLMVFLALQGTHPPVRGGSSVGNKNHVVRSVRVPSCNKAYKKMSAIEINK